MKRAPVHIPEDSFVLSKEQQTVISIRHAELKKQISEMNRKINNDSHFRQDMIRSGKWNTWLDTANVELAEMIREHRDLGQVLSAHIKAVRAKGSTRNRAANGNAIYHVMRAAQDVIGNLMEKCGDEWTDDIRQLCANLRNYGKEAATLVRPEVVDQIKDDHDKEMSRQKREYELRIASLQHHISDIQKSKNRARVVLERLYNTKYQEVDEFRTSRGITHRIHLTQDDCNEIDQVIS